MAKKSLAELASAFKEKTSGGGDQNWKLMFPFWKAPTDSTSTVRFLPDADDENPMGFLVENFTHTLIVNGKKETVACLKMFGEECPICALSQHYYDEKSADHNEALGKKYYRKKSYIGQVLVIDTPVEHDAEQLVKLIEFGPAVFKQIQSAFQSGDLEVAPYELKGGYNFRIRKTKSGEYASYTTSAFSPKQTDFADDVIEAMNLYNLADYRTPKTSRDVIDAMLVADQTGGSVATQEAAPASTARSHATVAAKAAPVADVEAEVAAPAPAPAPAAAPKLSVVEQLKARAAAQKLAASQAE